MARVAGVDLRHISALRSDLLISTESADLDPRRFQGSAVGVDTRIKDLSEDDLVRIRAVIEEQGEIEATCASACRWTSSVYGHRRLSGLRHRRGLPVRGQRTHTTRAPARTASPTIAKKKAPGKK